MTKFKIIISPVKDGITKLLNERVYKILRKRGQCYVDRAGRCIEIRIKVNQ